MINNKIQSNRGISMITLVITIIVIIILAVVAFGAATDAIGNAMHSNFAAESDNFNKAIEDDYGNRQIEISLANAGYIQDKQIYYAIATGNKTATYEKTKPTGLVSELESGLGLYGENRLKGKEYYEIKDDTNIEFIKEEKTLYQKGEKHYVTDEGEFFTLPGFTNVDKDDNRWYINADKYYDGEAKIEVNGEIVNAEENMNENTGGDTGGEETENPEETDEPEIELPEDNEYVIYDVNELDPNIEYVDILVQGGELEMLYGAIPANLIIPVAACYDGVWYKVVGLGSEAFRWCDTLESIVIPQTVTKIYTDAFWDADNLTKITLLSGNPTYYSRDNCIIEKATKTLVKGCKASVIPTDGSVTTIGECAFIGCDITSIDIPDSVTALRGGCFEECTELTSVKLSNNVTMIDNYAFGSCTNLTINDIPNKLKIIGNSAFSGIKFSNTNLVLPETITSIGTGAFANTNIQTIKIPDVITTIENRVFFNCKNLKSVTLGNKTTSIAYEAFAGCENLININLPNTIKTIDDGAFKGCSSLGNISIPTSVTTLGHSAFWQCSKAFSVVIIPEGTEVLDGYVFRDCTAITEVYIPTSVTTIKALAFGNCTNLTKINYAGTKAEWYSIRRVYVSDGTSDWDYNTGNYTIYCTDGTISK